MIDGVYVEFKTRVAEGRNMTFDEVENVAAGRLFSASGALEAGLIDYIGTLQDAIDKAAEMASITRFSTLYYPRRRTIFELFMEDNLNLGLARSIITNRLSIEPFTDTIRLLEDIQTHPVQMRSEVWINDL
jgi:protease-4